MNCRKSANMPARRLTPLAAVALAAIFCVAGFLRVFDLAANPSGMQVDEASIAFDAWLIGETGKDEKGRYLPLYPMSSWNPKHPAYFYPEVLVVKTLGLSPFAARLTSVFFGLAGVLGIFLLGRLLFSSVTVALVASAMLAFAPWSVHFSRLGFEAISFPAYFSFAVYFLLKGLEGRAWLVIPGAVCAGLCFYAYPVALVFVPLFLTGLLIINIDTVRRVPGRTVAAALVVAAFFLPLAMGHFRADAGLNDYFEIASIDSEAFHSAMTGHLLGKGSALFDFIARYAPARTLYGFCTNYISYFSPSFLFSRGDTNSLVHGPRDYGQLLHACAFLLPVGVYFLLRDFRGKHARTMLLWLLLFPVGASTMTWGQQHGIRSLIGDSALQLTCAYGLVRLTGLLSAKKQLAAVVSAVIVMAFAASAGPYYRDYFTKFPSESSIFFAGGFQEALDDMMSARLDGKVKTAAITTVIPYVYTHLFFYSPPTVEDLVWSKSESLDISATAENIGVKLCEPEDIPYFQSPAMIIMRPGQLPEGIFLSKTGDREIAVRAFKTYKTSGGEPSYTSYLVYTRPVSGMEAQ